MPNLALQCDLTQSLAHSHQPVREISGQGVSLETQVLFI